MVKKKLTPSLWDEGISLFFRTIPSERTNEVNIELPPGTNWDIGRNDRGVYLRKVIRPRKYGDFHQLSNFVDLSIAEYGFRADFLG